MSARPERVAASAGIAALAMGAVGMAFERAGPSVMTAPPEEFAAWAAEHHRELTAQSAVYLTSTAPLLAYFAGLSRSLTPKDGPALLRSAAVLAGGATWLGFQAAAQTEQLAMAREAVRGAPPRDVTGRGSRMRELLTWGNAALGGALAATAGQEPLPRWLRGVSAAAAVAHVAPVVVGWRGPAPAGVVEVLPYPLFVAWLVGVVVVLGRRAADH